MKIAVCEAGVELERGDSFWNKLCRELQGVDLFVFNELPFGPWIASAENYDQEVFVNSINSHQQGLDAFDQLGPLLIASCQPAFEGFTCVNQGIIWSKSSGTKSFHTKQFFPDHQGYHEARWFSPGTQKFEVGRIEGVKIGLLLCTDVMFNEWARHYGRQGADIIAVPRATAASTISRWKTALSMAAIVSGSFVASSNRSGRDKSGNSYGGSAVIFSPRGELIAETSVDNPIAVAEIDLSLAVYAKQSYPCDVAVREIRI